MTKPKPAEFTDYASALKFLKAGRGKGGKTRPTADGWNTTADVLDAHRIGLTLHGRTVIEYLDDGSVKIDAHRAQADFVTRERVNKYAMVPRNMRIDIAGVHGVLAKVRGIEPWSWDVFMGPVTGNLLIDKSGAISYGLAPTAIKRSAPWRNTDLMTQWAKRAADAYRVSTYDINEGVTCPGCTIVDDDGQQLTSLSDITNDREHLVAHVMNMEFPGELLLSIAQWRNAATFKADVHWDAGKYGGAEFGFEIYLRYISAAF